MRKPILTGPCQSHISFDYFKLCRSHLRFYRIATDPYAEVWIILINIAWVCYNLLVLGAASAVALERKQVRSSPRVACNIRAQLELKMRTLFLL